MARSFPVGTLRKLPRMRKSCGACSLHALVEDAVGASAAGGALGSAVPDEASIPASAASTLLDDEGACDAEANDVPAGLAGELAVTGAGADAPHAAAKAS